MCMCLRTVARQCAAWRSPCASPSTALILLGQATTSSMRARLGAAYSLLPCLPLPCSMKFLSALPVPWLTTFCGAPCAAAVRVTAVPLTLPRVLCATACVSVCACVWTGLYGACAVQSGAVDLSALEASRIWEQITDCGSPISWCVCGFGADTKTVVVQARYGVAITAVDARVSPSSV
jgi:hypothetical protein